MTGLELVDADWGAIKEQMKELYVVLDGRNALAHERMRGLGFRYAGIGRSKNAPGGS